MARGLVTGGAGFFGEGVVAKLLERVKTSQSLT
jgi:uncharacterized protein YbjT (DUF2867 family)